MRSKKMACSGCFLVLLLPWTMVQSQGVGVRIQLTSQIEIAGELLSVRDSSLVVSTAELGEQETPPAELSSVRIIHTRDVEKVIVAGNSRVLQGMGKGILYGGVMGAALGLISGDDSGGIVRFTAGEKAVMVGVLFAGGGLVVGTIAGAASSTGERVITPLPGGDFSVLKFHARYAAWEPPWLQAMK